LFRNIGIVQSEKLKEFT